MTAKISTGCPVSIRAKMLKRQQIPLHEQYTFLGIKIVITNWGRTFSHLPSKQTKSV